MENDNMRKNVVVGNKPLVFYIQYIISVCNGDDVILSSRGRNLPTACWLAIVLTKEQNYIIIIYKIDE